MNSDHVPIGETRTIVDNSRIRITFTRTSHDYGETRQFDPFSGRLVLLVRVGIITGSSELIYVDGSFWTLTLNGQPTRLADLPDKVNIKTNVETRTVNFTT